MSVIPENSRRRRHSPYNSFESPNVRKRRATGNRMIIQLELGSGIQDSNKRVENADRDEAIEIAKNILTLMAQGGLGICSLKFISMRFLE